MRGVVAAELGVESEYVMVRTTCMSQFKHSTLYILMYSRTMHAAIFGS